MTTIKFIIHITSQREKKRFLNIQCDSELQLVPLVYAILMWSYIALHQTHEKGGLT